MDMPGVCPRWNFHRSQLDFRIICDFFLAITILVITFQVNVFGGDPCRRLRSVSHVDVPDGDSR